MSFHNNWRKFLAEGSFKEKKLLREITEDELEHMDDRDLYEYLREMWAMSNFIEGELGIELARA